MKIPTEVNKSPLETLEAQNPKLQNNQYVPASDSCRSVDTVVPASMRYEMHKAIETVDRRVNGVDEYVAEKLGYIVGNCTLDQRKEGLRCLCDAFSAEQVDAIAVAIYNIEQKGQGCIIGDQTGIGKGRIAAGMIRYAIHRGLKPIFLTEKPNLFSDIFRDIINIGSDDDIPEYKFTGYREVERKMTTDSGEESEAEEQEDLADEEQDTAIVRIPIYEKNGQYPKFTREIIGKDGQPTGEFRTIIGKNFCRPFIVNGRNAKTDIKNEQGHILYRGDAKLVQEVIGTSTKRGTFSLPDEYKFVLATYSQFRGATESFKMAFLKTFAAGNVVIMDESHNASGASNTGVYLKEVLAATAGCVFLSATFAKRPDNMPIYASKTAMADANMTPEDLVQAIANGGVALQEIVSAGLVTEGQMIRRERSFEGIEVNYEYMDASQDARGYPNLNKEQEHRAIMDRATEIIREIISFQLNFVNPVIANLDQAMAAEYKGVETRKGTAEVGISNPPAFSGVFNVINQLLFSLKAEAVAEVAIQRLKEGKKPVIAFANTMESFLSTMTGDDGRLLGDGDAISSDFAKILEKRLRGVLRYTVKDGDERIPKTLVLEEQSEQFQNEFKFIMQKIKKSSIGICSSPIDVLIDRIQKAGFSVLEVTGRDRQLQLMKNDMAVIKTRIKVSANDAFRQFNNNEVDCLLINQSGSTGASAHALPTSKVPKDKVRQRVMIILQAELNINTEVQKRGRINRTGQIMLPIYDYVISAIPAEKRLMMMLQKKLKSLDANTTSNQKQSRRLMDASQADFLNKYGDQVVVDFLKENALINSQIGDPLKLIGATEEELEKIKGQEGNAHKVSGRVAILSVREQELFYQEMAERYIGLIDYLIQTGEYDLEVEDMNLEAETIDKQIVVGGKGAESVFGRNSVLEKCEVNNLKKPFKAQEIKAMLKESLDGYEPKALQASMIEKAERWYKNKVEELIINENEHWDNVKKEVSGEKRIIGLKGEEKDEAIRERMDAIEASREKSIENIHTKYKNLRDGTISLLKWFYVGRVVGYPGVNYGVDKSWAKALFIGFDIKDSAKNPYAPSAMRMRFAIASSQKYIALPASKWEIVSAIKEITYEHIYGDDLEQALEKWDDSVKRLTAARSTRYIVTGNILQAYGNEALKGSLVSYTTKDGGVKKGILLPDYWSPESGQRGGEKRKELKITVPIEKALIIIKNLSVGAQITTTDGFIIYRKDWEMVTLSVPLNKQKYGKYYLDQTIMSMVLGGNFEKVSAMMRARMDIRKIGNLVEYLQEKFSAAVELSQAQFEIIKDQFEIKDYQDEVKKPQPEVFIETLTEEEKSEAARQQAEQEQERFEDEQRMREAEEAEKKMLEMQARRQGAANKLLNLMLIMKGQAPRYAKGGRLSAEEKHTRERLLDDAYKLGQLAFMEGKARVPWHDPELRKFMEGRHGKDMKFYNELLTKYLNGYDHESVSMLA